MLKKITVFFMLLVFVSLPVKTVFSTEVPRIKLGNEMLMSKYHYLIEGKRVGLVTNQSGSKQPGRALLISLQTTNDQFSCVIRSGARA